MVLNQREKTLAIVVGAAVGLCGIFYLGVKPYFDKRDELANQLAQYRQDEVKNDALFLKQKKFRRVWDEMTAGGRLKADAAEADSQLLHAMQDWMLQSGINLTTQRPERASEKGRFQMLTYHFTGSGSMAAVSRLLWRIETAPIPVRVNDVQINSTKPGEDELQVQLSLSTLWIMPESNKTDKTKANPARPVAAADYRPEW